MSKKLLIPESVEKPEILFQEVSDYASGTSIWNTTFYFEDVGIVSSGTSRNKNRSFNKCYAESMERFFLVWNKEDIRYSSFLFSEFPTTACMAGGFNPISTLKRSIFEGYERFVRILLSSNSISLDWNNGLEIPDSSIYEKWFENVSYFSCTVKIPQNNFIDNCDLTFVLCFGEVEGKVFIGYAIDKNLIDAAFHALVESYRNRTILDVVGNYHRLNQKYWTRIIENSENKKIKFIIEKKKKEAKVSCINLPPIEDYSVVPFWSGYVARTFIHGYKGQRNKEYEFDFFL